MVLKTDLMIFRIFDEDKIIVSEGFLQNLISDTNFLKNLITFELNVIENRKDGYKINYLDILKTKISLKLFRLKIIDSRNAFLQRSAQKIFLNPLTQSTVMNLENKYLQKNEEFLEKIQKKEDFQNDRLKEWTIKNRYMYFTH